MAKESTYKITFTNGNTISTAPIIQQFADHRKISFQVANSAISRVITELQEPIIESRKDHLLRFFGHVNFTEFTCERVKRKYVRKTQLPDAPEQEVPQVIDDTIGYTQPENLHGLIVPVGTIIAVFPKGQTYGKQYYRIVSIENNTIANIRVCDIKGRITQTYDYRQGIQGINKSLRLKHWHLVNETPAFLEALRTYTNVVPYRQFKRTDTERNGNNRVIANSASYAIEVEGARIPFSPGFTGNCQLTVLGSMNTLLQLSSDLKGQLKEVYHAAGRKLLLCDVNLHNVKLIEEKLPKSWIHSKMPYKSTNGSDMVVCLIDISKK